MMSDVYVEVIDEVNDMSDDENQDMERNEYNTEIKTFLLQMKLQLDERDAENIQFEFESPTSILVKCFVPLLSHSSMLPIIPLIYLRIQETNGSHSVEIVSNTHIHVPQELFQSTGHSHTRFAVLPSLKKKMEFVRAVPVLVSEFIAGMHSHDPQPPHPQAPAPPAAQSPPPATSTPANQIFFPLMHMPGDIFNANEVQNHRVTVMMVAVTKIAVYLLHPGPTRSQVELTAITQIIPYKDISRVINKRGNPKSFVIHFKEEGVPCKPIFSIHSDRIVSLIQSHLEKRTSKRRHEATSSPPPRLTKKNSGFDVSSFFSNVEKATKELSQKVVGGLSEVTKLLAGEHRPTVESISQLEADFFRRPTFGQLYTITEQYKTLVLESTEDDRAEINMFMFVHQPQVQRLLHS